MILTVGELKRVLETIADDKTVYTSCHNEETDRSYDEVAVSVLEGAKSIVICTEETGTQFTLVFP